MEGKRRYVRPELRILGSVADLTRTGLTNSGADAKAGSRLSEGK